MKINKVLTIIILILTIIILILSFKIQKNITNSKKIDISKIVIPKVIIPQTITPKKEENKKNIEQDNLTEDEIQNILSKLKALEHIEEKKIIPVVKKSKVDIKKNIVKKTDKIIKKQTVKYIKSKEIIVEKPSYKNEPTITEEEYRKRLAKESKVDDSIASLSMVNTVDMDIEQKIKKGKVKELTTPKPIVLQKTIQIPSNEKKINDNIPWANLLEIDERVDGIFIDEDIVTKNY